MQDRGSSYGTVNLILFVKRANLRPTLNDIVAAMVSSQPLGCPVEMPQAHNPAKAGSLVQIQPPLPTCEGRNESSGPFFIGRE